MPNAKAGAAQGGQIVCGVLNKTEAGGVDTLFIYAEQAHFEANGFTENRLVA